MKNDKKKNAIRFGAIAVAALLFVGIFSAWALSTQETATAEVGIGDAPPGLEINDAGPGDLISDGIQGRPDSVNEEVDLFTVAKEEDNLFDGNYEVTVSIVNIDEIKNEYRYLNLDLEADESDAGYLTLENGRVSFAIDSTDIEDGDEVTISVEGGSYQAIDDTATSVEFLIDVEEGSVEDPLDLE